MARVPVNPAGPLADALWRVHGYEAVQRVPPGADYRWENRRRRPRDAVVLQLTLAGELELEERGERRRAGAHEAALFAFDEASSYALPPPPRPVYACRWVTLVGAGLRAHWDALRAEGGGVLPCPPEAPLAAALSALIAHAERRVRDPLDHAAAVQAFVRAVADHWRRRRLAALPPAERAVERIRAAPHHPWSLKELAAEVGCSREHLIRVFRARTGEPPARWLARVRLERALHLLRHSDLPVAAVARQCGFASAHTLARHVRRATGCAPRNLGRGRGGTMVDGP